jgi:hypothetical protein
VVLASIGPLSYDRAIGGELPVGYFDRSAQGYRRTEDADGFPTIHIVDLKLVRQ